MSSVYRVTFARPSQKLEEGETLSGVGVEGLRVISADLGECRIFPEYLQIWSFRYGKTKYLAYGLGLLGSVLKPVLGSLSGEVFLYTIRWENLRWVRFDSIRGEILICGATEESDKKWLCMCACKCDQTQQFLQELASRVPMGVSMRVPIEKDSATSAIPEVELVKDMDTTRSLIRGTEMGETILGLSADGQRVFFVSKESLSANEIIDLRQAIEQGRVRLRHRLFKTATYPVFVVKATILDRSHDSFWLETLLGQT